MGLFDGFKDAFENDPKLAQKRLADNKKKGQSAAYIQKKEAARRQYEATSPGKAGGKKEGNVKTGNEVLDQIFKGWTWE